MAPRCAILLLACLASCATPALRVELPDALRSRDGAERLPVTLAFDPAAPEGRRFARLEVAGLHAQSVEIPFRLLPRGDGGLSAGFEIQMETSHANRVPGRFDVVLELWAGDAEGGGTFWGTFRETEGGRPREGGLGYETAGPLRVAKP